MSIPFSTSDLNLASTLDALGYQLLELDRSQPQRVRFLFARTRGIENVINDYWGDKIKLPPQQLFAAQKKLKNRLYAER